MAKSQSPLCEMLQPKISAQSQNCWIRQDDEPAVSMACPRKTASAARERDYETKSL